MNWQFLYFYHLCGAMKVFQVSVNPENIRVYVTSAREIQRKQIDSYIISQDAEIISMYW